MSIGINIEICHKLECKYAHEWIPGRYGNRCCILDNKCTQPNYHHKGCIVPEKCKYKNLHILNKYSLYRDFKLCGDCRHHRRGKESKRVQE